MVFDSFHLLILKMIWQDISSLSSKKSKIKKKGGDGISVAPDSAELQGQCMLGS